MVEQSSNAVGSRRQQQQQQRARQQHYVSATSSTCRALTAAITIAGLLLQQPTRLAGECHNTSCVHGMYGMQTLTHSQAVYDTTHCCCINSNPPTLSPRQQLQ
jgi:hypothetical protein